MAHPKFTIPDEFASQLRFRPCADTRSDDEILRSLTKHVPVEGEKNIWAYWHAGVLAMPPWCQRNVIDWVRVNGPAGWTVRVLDSVHDSPNNALKFVPIEMLPESFVKGKMDGPYVGPHSADFLRGPCLYLHGGVYMDVGNILIRELDRICWKDLEAEENPFRVCVPWMYGTVMANHFVAARKGDEFIKRWHELFTTLWRGHTNYEGVSDTPLFAPLQESMSFDDSRMSNFHWDFSVPAKTVMEYITQVLCWQRLCMLEDAGDGFSGVEYWTKHVLIFDVLQENWGGEATLGFPGFGQKFFDCLTTRLDANPDSAQYKDAHKVVWRLLTQSSMQKVTHGKGLTNDLALGVLLDRAQNRDSDHGAGTFAELLRYGTVNFEQTREKIRDVEAPRPAKTLKKGLLEA